MEIIATTSEGQIVHIGSTDNRCMICGAEIPEGREICPGCEHGV